MRSSPKSRAMNADRAVRLSVCVPVYGVERFIGDCARSLFSQSLWDGVEFLFVDDASPDGSIDVLGRVLAEYPGRTRQVRILRHPANRGLAAARRTAIDAARGEWLLHVDSDDLLLPGALARLLARAEEVPAADLIFGSYFASDDPADEAVRRYGVRVPRMERLRLLRTLVSQSHRVANRTWGVLIRRTLCTERGIFPVEGIDFAEDYAVMPRLVHAAREVAAADGPVYGYRLANAGSYMKRLDARAADQYVAANRVVTDYLKGQPDYDLVRDSAMLGRLNIAKWILKRGLRPEEWDRRLFYDGDRPTRLLHRIYAAALECEIPLLARAAGVAANLAG